MHADGKSTNDIRRMTGLGLSRNVFNALEITGGIHLRDKSNEQSNSESSDDGEEDTIIIKDALFDVVPSNDRGKNKENRARDIRALF